VDGIPPAIEKFYTHVKPIRRKLRNRLVRYAEATELVIKFTRQSISATDAINIIGRQVRPDWSEIHDEDTARGVIFSVFQDQLYSSARKLIFNPEPIGNDPKMA